MYGPKTDDVKRNGGDVSGAGERKHTGLSSSEGRAANQEEISDARATCGLLFGEGSQT